MTKIVIDLDDPKLHKAANQISAAIRDQFSDAQLSIEEGYDPPKLYVVAVVDVEDTELVMDTYLDMLLEFQIEDRLPLDVIVYQTPKRQQAENDRARARYKLCQLDHKVAETPMAVFDEPQPTNDFKGLLAYVYPALEHPRIKAAIEELTAMILNRFPGSQINAELGDDPLGIYLYAVVDLDDSDEVMDLVVDRLIDLNVEEGIPIHVIPRRTEKRERAMRAEAGKHLKPMGHYE